MAARAIIGILLGILFAPVIFLVLASINPLAVPSFANWFWSMTSDFNAFLTGWIGAGINSTVAPLFSYGVFTGSLIDGFGPSYGLLSQWLPTYAPALVTWGIIGVWAGAIERSPGRGLGVGIGIWLGWMIIGLIYILAILPIFPIIDLLLAMLLTAIVVIVAAVIIGAMTKSEEF